MEALPFLMRGLASEEISTLQPDLGEFGQRLFAQLLKLTSADEDYAYTLKKCKDRNKPFIDDSFPANQTSLLYPFHLPQRREKAEKWKKFVWKKWIEFMDPSSTKIFQGPIIGNCIKHGALGDCRFLSALSILAERPNFIESLFITKEINDYGLFGIKLFHNGVEKVLLLDGFLPCKSDGGLCFAECIEGGLWVPLLEKAWAKLHGSYALIEDSSTPLEAIMETLTGAPCVVLNHDDDALWSSLMEAKERRWIMSGSAANTKASKELLEEMGLAGNFGYAILDVEEFVMKEGTEQIIKLRNPWGSQEWAGEWGNTSNVWTEELRQKLSSPKEVMEKERSFWMSFGDFCHYFSRVQICKVYDNYTYSSLKLSPIIRPACVKMRVTEKTTGYLSLFQPDNGYYSHRNYEYALARLIIAKIETNPRTGAISYEYIKGNMKLDRELSEDHIFDEGDYILYIEVEKNKSKKTESLKLLPQIYGSEFMPAEEEKGDTSLGDMPYINLTLYAKKGSTLIGDEYAKHPQFIEKVYSSCAITSGDRFVYEADGAPQCVKYSEVRKEGYGYTYFENNSDDATIKEAVTYTMFDGLELVPPFKGTSYEVLVPPKTSMIVLLKQTSNAGYNLSFSYTSNIIFTTEAMKRRIKEYGTKATRKDPRVNWDVDINVYTLKHGGGICYLYENLTPNSILEEKVKFKTNGLEIVGEEGSDISINIGPGESKFIELRAVNSNWNIQTSVSYGISPARKQSDDDEHKTPLPNPEKMSLLPLCDEKKE